jgi:hypothetical protein
MKENARNPFSYFDKCFGRQGQERNNIWLIFRTCFIQGNSHQVFTSIPVQWFDGVTQTLAQLRRQKDVCESVLETRSLCFPSMRQSAIICNQFGRKPGFVSDRAEPSASDSGWFCGCDHQHDHQNIWFENRKGPLLVFANQSDNPTNLKSLPVGKTLSTSNGLFQCIQKPTQVGFVNNSWIEGNLKFRMVVALTRFCVPDHPFTSRCSPPFRTCGRWGPRCD